jgi:hypothetical protein
MQQMTKNNAKLFISGEHLKISHFADFWAFWPSILYSSDTNLPSEANLQIKEFKEIRRFRRLWRRFRVLITCLVCAESDVAEHNRQEQRHCH